MIYWVLMGYTSQAIKGIMWAGGLSVFLRAISFFRVVVLARLLVPSEFGQFGIAVLALTLLETFTETGVNVFLIQEKNSLAKYLNSAWIVSIMRGGIIFFVMLSFANVIANFFRTPSAGPLLILFSAVPLIRGFINPAIVKFQKEINFAKEFFFRLTISLTEAFVVISFAFFTHSALALVIGAIASAILELALSFSLIFPRPRLKMQKAYFGKIIHHGKWVTFSGIFNYLFHNLDSLVIGKILGPSSLGLYQMAYNISMLPLRGAADIAAKVTFPIYALISEDRKRLKRAFLKSLVVLSIITIAFGIVFSLFSHEAVRLILGHEWLGITNVLQILVIFGVIRAISGYSSALLFSVGKQKYVTLVTLASFFALGVTIIPLVYFYGIYGAGISALIGSLASLPFMFYFTLKVLRGE